MSQPKDSSALISNGAVSIHTSGTSSPITGSSSNSNSSTTANIISKTSPTAPALDEIWSRKNLQELVKRIDTSEQLDEDVEDFVLNYAEEYMQGLVQGAAILATHRNSSTIDVKDVQTHLERTQNIWVPGFGTEELRPYKRSPLTEAHKQRTAIMKKALKKY